MPVCLSRLITVLCLLAATSLGGVAVNAHTIKPAIVTVSALEGTDVRLALAFNLEAWLAGIGPEHDRTQDAPQSEDYERLRRLDPGRLETRLDLEARRKLLDTVGLSIEGMPVPLRLNRIIVPPVGNPDYARLSVITLDGVRPRAHHRPTTISWKSASPFPDAIVKVRNGAGEVVRSAYVASGSGATALQLRPTTSGSIDPTTIWNFVPLGFSHILPKGIDHILFVLALFLLSRDWKSLLIQVTAFTIAHSITLALGLYGIVNLDPKIVEPLIALSIVAVALENLWTRRVTPLRPLIVFAFGLLHGLGFASILSEIGLPRADFLSALIGFNIGVELGQIAVLALAWLTLAIWFSSDTAFRRAVAIPGSILIALIGAYWTAERMGLFV